MIETIEKIGDLRAWFFLGGIALLWLAIDLIYAIIHKDKDDDKR